MEPVVIIGYSGHAYVVIEIFQSKNRLVTGYCEQEEKSQNPYQLRYFGQEHSPSVLQQLKEQAWFVAIGDNRIRGKVYQRLLQANLKQPAMAIHAQSIVSPSAKIGEGTMISAGVVVNAQSQIGVGVICNTACVIEHECIIGNFAHIAPGAVLAGNVEIGEYSFVGANAVVKQGVKIGKNVTIGAGTTIIKDVPDDVTIVGNPGRIIKTL